MRKDVEGLIKSNSTCVPAALSGIAPRCSLVSYVPSDDCRGICRPLGHELMYQNEVENMLVEVKASKLQKGITEACCEMVT